MKNINWTNQRVRVLRQKNTIEGIYKQIELAGRTCYKSLDKITDDSSSRFVNFLIASHHWAMLEHATVYLKIPCNPLYIITHLEIYYGYLNNKYSVCKKVSESGRKFLLVTTNFRVLIENGWERDLKYLCNPTPEHEKRYTVLCTTNLQVSHELVRHRTMSFAQESSRYCNYTKDKFGNSLTFVTPCWDTTTDDNIKFHYEKALTRSAVSYFGLIEHGWTPQQAAQVLPKALKTDIIITGFKSDWDHFMDLRYAGKTGAPHPQMKELASLILIYLKNEGYNYEEIKQC